MISARKTSDEEMRRRLDRLFERRPDLREKYGINRATHHRNTCPRCHSVAVAEGRGEDTKVSCKDCARLAKAGAAPGTIHTWAHGEQAQKQADGTWKVKLYRAATHPEVNTAGTTSFSPDRAVAEAYLDGRNPGFGGANLYRVEPDVDPRKVLDVREGMPRWLEEIAEGHGGGASNSWVLTASDKARQSMLDRGYQWVRFMDDYPTGAETWALVDEDHGEEAVEPKMRKLKKSLPREKGLGPHGYPPGTVHEWDGVKMRKEANGEWKPVAQQALDLGDQPRLELKPRKAAPRRRSGPAGTQLDLLADRPQRVVQERDQARKRQEHARKNSAAQEAEQAELKAKLARAEAIAAATADWKANGIRAKSFKSWFGDWESTDPKVLAKISKVRDKVTGEPKRTWQLHLGGRKAAINAAKQQGASVVVGPSGPVTAYHGTSRGGFTAFDPKKFAKDSLYGPGFYFTEDPAAAESYTKKGRPRYVTDLEGATQENVQAFLDEVFTGTKYIPKYDLKNEKHWASLTSILDHINRYPSVAEKHGIKVPKRQVYSVYLNIRNPFDVDHTEIDIDALPPSRPGRDRTLHTLINTGSWADPADAQYVRDLTARDWKVAWAAGIALVPKLQDQALHTMMKSMPPAVGTKGPDIAAYAKGMAKNHTYTDPEMQPTYKYFREHPEVLLENVGRNFSEIEADISNPYGKVNYRRLAKYAGDDPSPTGNKAGTTELLRQLGYDGITHIGGKASGRELLHRVWIAFEPTQIKAADNQGTFDPKEADMTKSDEPVEKSLLLGDAFGKLNDEQHHALHEAHQWYTGRMGKSLTGDEMETYSPFEDLCKSLDVDPVPIPEELRKGEPSQPPAPGPAGPPPPTPRPGAPAPTPPGSTPAPSAPVAVPPKPAAPPGPPMPQGPDKGPDEDNEDAPGPGKFPPLVRSTTETLDAGVLARSLPCETGERLAKLIEKGDADCPYDHREQFDTSWLKQKKA